MSSPLQPDTSVGSREWWDYQLAHSWERHHGPQQTRHFMQRLVAHLAQAERAYLEMNPATILDWGCAHGDGAAVLAEAFPRCQVAGLDIAPSAIDAARQRYPALEFILTETGEIPRPFDVVVTSNCLEHFADPLAWTRAHLAAARRLYVALVPYREYPPIETHLVSLTEATFPAYLAGWTRLYTRVVGVAPDVWAGGQLLVVYGAPDYVRQRPPDAATQPAWRVYLAAPPDVRALVEDLAARQAQAETRLAEAEAALTALAEAGWGDGASAGVLDRKDLLVQVARQERELAALRGQVHTIMSSRAWTLTERLWQWRGLLAPPGSRRERLWYRATRRGSR